MSDLPVIVTSIPGRLGARANPFADPGRATLTVHPNVCTHGVVHTAVWMMAADMAAGMTDDAQDPDYWHFTSDCSLRLSPRLAPERAEGHLTLLRRGRAASVSEVRFLGPEGDELGVCDISFARVPRRPGDPTAVVEAFIERMAALELPPLDTPLPHAAGLVVVDPGTGMVEAKLTDDLRQPAGMMQGAMVTLMGEYAAQVLAEHAFGGAWIVPELDIRFLVGGRVGPMRATARWIGDPADGLVRAELRDAGKDDRLCTVFLGRVVPAPQPA